MRAFVYSLAIETDKRRSKKHREREIYVLDVFLHYGRVVNAKITGHILFEAWKARQISNLLEYIEYYSIIKWLFNAY